MATPSNRKSNAPLIAVIAVVVIGVLIYVLTRGSSTGGNHAAAPAPLKGKTAEMARNPGKLVVLSAPRVTKLPRSNELGTGREGWAVEVAYTWKDKTDGQLTFKAPFIAAGRSNYALPAKGTAGAKGTTGAKGTAAAESPTGVNGTAAAKGTGAATDSGKGADAAPASSDPTFLLPQAKGKLRLLLPSTPALKLKKGDKIALSLQAEILVEGKPWQIPASNEVKLPPLP